MKRDRAVIWDSLFTVLAVYKEILPGSLFTTGAEFWIQSCLISKWSCFMVSTRTLGVVSSSSVSGTVVLLVCAPNLIRVTLHVLSKFSLLISHLGRHFILEGLFFAWVGGDSRPQQQQVFGPDIMNQAGRVYIPWNLNNLGSHLGCLTVTYFMAGAGISCCYLTSLFWFLLAGAEISK